MKYIDYQEAISQGADPQGLIEFAKTNGIELRNTPQSTPIQQETAPIQQPTTPPMNDLLGQPTPNPIPTPPQQQQTQVPTVTPDVVTPLANPTQTQYIGENPQNYPMTGGHAGVDEIPADGNWNVTNPIGGRAFPFQQYPGYGNAVLMVGGNPQEVAGMSPEEIQRIQDEVNGKAGGAYSAADFNIPGRDVSIQGHLSDIGGIQSGQPVATGAASMTMGGTGTPNNSVYHTHTEINDRNGNQVDPIKFYQSKTGKQYPINPDTSSYSEDEIRRILATYR
jgi:hypothetical protein